MSTRSTFWIGHPNRGGRWIASVLHDAYPEAFSELATAGNAVVFERRVMEKLRCNVRFELPMHTAAPGYPAWEDYAIAFFNGQAWVSPSGKPFEPLAEYLNRLERTLWAMPVHG